ncbi:MAG: hypothetical protein ACE1ZA_22475, partial [Pseudomonadales bacterium]
MKFPRQITFSIVVWISSLAAVHLAGPTTNAEDWPQWRGPRSDGISRETRLLVDWREQTPR